MRKIINTLFILVLLFLDSSCIHEKTFDWENTGNPDEAKVILRLKTPNGFSSSKSRALSHSDENAIADIHVLVFNNANTLVAIKQGEDVTTEGSSDPMYSGTGSFTVTLEASKTTIDTYKLVVLANAESILSNTIGLDVTSIPDKSYTAVTAKILVQISGAMFASGGTIPMWGESEQLIIEPGNNNQSLDLTRAVARIDVGVGKVTNDGTSWDGLDADDNEIPFTLTSVYIIRPNNQYAVVPNTSLTAGNPTVPAGTAAFSLLESENNFAFATHGGFTSHDIYIPEADILMGEGGKSGDVYHMERMAVVVGGSYKGGATTYYRLDFAKDGNLMNVLRNHLYQFNISSVSGDGYPDVETAYNSFSMNMSVNVLEWDEMEIFVFDGQYMLGLNTSEFELYRKASINTLVITTDYPSGWTLTIKDENGNTIDPTTGWIREVSRTNNGIGEKDYFEFEVDIFTGSPERIAYFHVTAGRLTSVVKVVQTDFLPFMLQLEPSGEIEFISGSALPVGQEIESQIVNISWEPSDQAISYKIFSVIGNNGLTFLQPISQEDQISGGDVNLILQPAKFTAVELETNPFLEKVSRLEVTASNDNGESIVRTLTIKQKNYAVIPTLGSYLLNGETNSIIVKANAPWEAELIVGGTAIAQLTSTNGSGNSIYGESLNFIMNQGDGANYEGISQIRIFSPDDLFEEVIIDIKTDMLFWVGNLGYTPAPEGMDALVTYDKASTSCPTGYIMPTSQIITAWKSSAVPFPTTGTYWINAVGSGTYRQGGELEFSGTPRDRDIYGEGFEAPLSNITHIICGYGRFSRTTGDEAKIEFRSSGNGYYVVDEIEDATEVKNFTVLNYIRCVRQVATK